MSFRSMSKGKSVKEDWVRIHIRYLDDGTMDSHIEGYEGFRWRTITMTFFEQQPSWDLLHKCQYIHDEDDVFTPPAAITGLINHMKFTEHCRTVKKFNLLERLAWRVKRLWT